MARPAGSFVMDNRPLNSSQQRARIDRGEEGDKVPGFDPAAAPFGTDEEAAGTPTPAGVVPLRSNVRPEPGFTTAPEDSIAPDAAPSRPRITAAWPIAAVIAVAAAVLACLLFFSGGGQG